MSTRGQTEGGRQPEGGQVSLPEAVPFSVPGLTRLSWDLGTRVVDDEAAEPIGEWAGTGRWRLSAVRVTEHTAVVRVRTPVGRERFYGAAMADLQSALPELESAPQWHRRE
ncbi:hypothetical protein [Halomicrobium salinisoli]|uniref:hypothetical protein n=1 Tax=Halomicrobium salinisoli TaxID=2878391 RepID=UPI001CF091E1|nr:hypothetical protein [Halomicrobium salinisoli]